MIVYINTIKASQKDYNRLLEDIKNGLAVTIKRTAKGNISITTHN